MSIASDVQYRAHHPHSLPPSAIRMRTEHESGDTIIDVPFETPAALRSMLLDPQSEDAASGMPADAVGERLFKIRAADSHGHRSSASILINKMYATRGYTTTGLPVASVPHKVTLVAEEKDQTVGTITVGFDSSSGLAVDELFRDEVNVMRWRGLRVCEFTKLAMDHAVRSKRVLASLFHVAYIYAHRLKEFDALLIEVNPRHVSYYERMLGFVVAGPERHNERVDAPAVLMSLDFAHARAQISRYGGKPQMSKLARCLYPYFFSVGEESGIVARIRPN